jgi:predicted MFS family arabinose efflux permease
MASTQTSTRSNTAAIVSVAMLIGVAFAGSTIITPLYVLFEDAFGFSKMTLTLIYASYVVGNLAALLCFGRLSDQIGRRAATLPALAILAFSSLSFMLASGVAELFIGRILAGFGVGIATGTGTAWLTELIGGQDKARATSLATSSNFLGIALAPLVAGLLADFAPWPVELPFAAYLAVVAVTAILVLRTRETVAAPKPLRGVSLWPRLGVPCEIRAAFVAPGLAGAAAMALIGFYAALAPSLLAESLHLKSHTLAGAVVCELGLMVAGAILLTRDVASRRAMTWALWLMLPSVALIVASQAYGSLIGMFAATAFCGAASGLGYRGSLQVVNEIAPAAQRAEVLSAYFICCFTGNSVPVIGVGIITMQAGALAASASFAVLIVLLALAALALTSGSARRASPPRPSAHIRP